MAPPRPEPRRNERWKIRKPTIGTRQAMNTLAVPEPGSTLGPSLARIVPGNLCDSVDRAQPGEVVRLEHDPARPQRRNGGIDVIDLERHLRVFPRWRGPAQEDGQQQSLAPAFISLLPSGRSD
jgi:hypothetical protein